MDNEYITLHELNSTKQRINMPGYCPISVKDEINKPEPFVNITNGDAFLSKKNIHSMVYYVTSLNEKNKTGKSPDKFKKEIPVLMKKWAKKEKINDFEDLNDNILLTLEFLNKKFLINYGCLYDRPGVKAINVFHNKAIVTDACNKQTRKKYDEMLASDYHTLDLWQPNEVFTYDKRNRYCNKIPIWQKSMNTRNLDLSNDGLHDAKADRASLDNQIHGYNMENIIKGSTYYENYYYENL
jgi:hypothetical protein